MEFGWVPAAFMVQLSNIYSNLNILRKNFCLISHLTVQAPAAKTGLLGRPWPAASCAARVTGSSSGWEDGRTAVEHQLCAQSVPGTQDTGIRPLPESYLRVWWGHHETTNSHFPRGHPLDQNEWNWYAKFLLCSLKTRQLCVIVLWRILFKDFIKTLFN